MILLFLLLISTCCLAFPECHYLCTDPVCEATCKPFCESASCQVCHNDTGTPDCSDTAACYVSCPTPVVYHNDSCPECDTVCPGSLCSGSDPHCYITCEAPVCSWKCQKPVNCPAPVCELDCEAPYCPYSGSPAVGLSLMGMLSLLLFFTQ